MNAFVVSIGSNVIEREAMMSRTVKWLEEQFDDVRVSEIYETPSTAGVTIPILIVWLRHRPACRWTML